MATIYLGLGANLGDREGNLRAACRHLDRGGVRLVRCSSLYETEPWGNKGQPSFLNAVCQAETVLDPFALLRLAKKTERALGRVEGPRYGPRPADIDILLYDDLVLETPELTIPHPHLAERAFVLVPLAEIAPDLRVPRLGRTARELLEELGEIRGVKVVGVVERQTSGGDREKWRGVSERT